MSLQMRNAHTMVQLGRVSTRPDGSDADWTAGPRVWRVTGGEMRWGTRGAPPWGADRSVSEVR